MLVAILRQIESKPGYADQGEVRAELGITKEEMWAAMQALSAAEYVIGCTPNGPIANVSAEARRELGAWPSAETLARQLVEGLEQAAANEQEPERKKLLESGVAALGRIGTEIIARVIENQLSL